ncbi:MAG TPA: response regulator [Bacteroidales bacterium]|nr:response regulator [Bacteroidales bacterium]
MERDWSKNSILVVDDDFTSIILFEEFLSTTQALIFSATNSKEALEIVRKHPVDVILMDIQLEDISGFILLSIIREINPNIPIVAETAFASADDRRRCIASGFNGYISKPISYAALIEELDKYLTS